MARFYAEIQGNRGKATRMGTASSGIYGHIRGYDIGARVDCDPSTEDQNIDEVSVILTGGSTGPFGAGLIFHAYRDEKGEFHLELAKSDIVREAARKLLGLTDE